MHEHSKTTIKRGFFTAPRTVSCIVFKMNCRVVLAVASLSTVVIAQHKLPSYIEACHINSPKFQECALESANAAIPHLVEGDKHLGIPRLDPLHLPLIEVQHSNLKLVLKDAVISGFKNTKVINLHIDRSVFESTMHIETLNILSNYNALGKILILNLEGSGASNITAVGGEYKIKSQLSRHTKNGLAFLKFGKPEMEFTLKRAYFDFENLLNGDERLGAEVNQILNDNWESVLTDLGAPIREAVSAIIESIVSNIVSKVPENKIFIE